MVDQSTHTIRVADIATSKMDRTDGPALLNAIRAGIEEHGVICLSFKDVHTLTPTLINEAMVPLLEDVSIEKLRTQIILVDATRPMADTIRRCMENGVRWNAGDLSKDSLIDRLARATPRDLGVTVIECRDEHLDIHRANKAIVSDLPKSGYDHRAQNGAPRSYRKKR